MANNILSSTRAVAVAITFLANAFAAHTVFEHLAALLRSGKYGSLSRLQGLVDHGAELGVIMFLAGMVLSLTALPSLLAVQSDESDQWIAGRRWLRASIACFALGCLAIALAIAATSWR